MGRGDRDNTLWLHPGAKERIIHVERGVRRLALVRVRVRISVE